MKVLEKSRDQLVLKTSRQKWFLGGFAATFDIVLLTISLATDWLAGSDLDVLMRGLFIFLGAYCVLYGLHTLVVSKTVIQTKAGPSLLKGIREEEERRWRRPPSDDMPP